jgi:hypothetical protein
MRTKLHKNNKQAEKMIFDTIDSLSKRRNIEKSTSEKQKEINEIITKKKIKL